MIKADVQGINEAISHLSKAQVDIPKQLYLTHGMLMNIIYQRIKARIPSWKRLNSSFVIRKEMQGDTVVGSLSTGMIYAAIQEQTKGQTIYPKNAKALTIPIGDLAKKAAGASWLSEAFFRARSYPNTFIAKGIIFQKQHDGTIRPLFKLAKSVKITGVGYASGALSDSESELIDRITGIIDANL